MKIGYSFWGYLGDTKYDLQGNKASTPDGNAFYSWSIINKLQEYGHKVYSIMPDRDYSAFCHKVENGKHLFDSWCTDQRKLAYTRMINIWDNNNFIALDSYYTIYNMKKNNQLYGYIANFLDKMDIVLHEWRMPIPGRNYNFEDERDYQPDLDIQECILKYFEERTEKKLIIFDLDYKLNIESLRNLKSGGNNVYVFELGYKWKDYCNAKHVEIPFDFRYINELGIEEDIYGQANNLVYVGNRYERDWCIDKYIPTEINGVKVYGNWKESGRDSERRWPNIKFGDRVQTRDMPTIYGESKATILLAKKEYLEQHFMTARILEAVFYGCVPLFIEEYGKETIEKYAGKLAPYLTVKSKADVIDCIYALEDDNIRIRTIKYLRKHLEFMDVSNFVNKIYEVM